MTGEETCHAALSRNSVSGFRLKRTKGTDSDGELKMRGVLPSGRVRELIKDIRIIWKSKPSDVIDPYCYHWPRPVLFPYR